MKDDNDPVVVKPHINVEGGGTGWLAIALLIIYFWSSEGTDGLPSLHAALVHYLMK